MLVEVNSLPRKSEEVTTFSPRVYRFDLTFTEEDKIEVDGIMFEMARWWE